MASDVQYNLAVRTTIFAKNIIKFAKLIPKNSVTMPLITQLVKSGTSIGANYSEADDAESKNDFKHKIGIAKKEARETRYWLDVIASTEPVLKDRAVVLAQEAKELNLIFNAIVRSANENRT